LSYQSENSRENEPKIKFVKDMHYSHEAICLYWIDEIHIDESLKNSPILNDIIRHEIKHYHIIKKIITLHKQGRRQEAFILKIYNNTWDILDSLRIFSKLLSLKLLKNLKKILTIAQVILFISAILDMILYVTINYHVPSFTISLFSIASILFIAVIKMLMK